jgi:hypothetical protein
MRVIRPFAAIALTSLTLLLCACGAEPSPRSLDFGSASGSGGTAPSGDQGVVTEWLAVFRTVDDVKELEADTADVKAIVGGAIVVSPVNCFEGMTIDDPGATYILGVVAPTDHELGRLVDEVGRATIFEGEVRTMCID